MVGEPGGAPRHVLADLAGVDLSRAPLPLLRSAAAQVDALLERIYRAREDELAAIEKQLVSAINDEWSGRIPGALDAALADLEASLVAGAVTEIEALRILEVVKSKMTFGFVDAVSGAVATGIDRSYGAGRTGVLKPLGIGVEWNVVDEHARKVLQQDTMFWVGSAWDRQLGGTIADAIRETVIEKGLGRVEAGEELQRIMSDEFPGRSLDYWTTVASAGVVRARSFGSVESFVQAEAETYQIIEVDDARTCATCAYMNGRIFTVDSAVRVRNAWLSAEDPEAAKAAQPWVTHDDVKDKSTEELQAAGVNLQPFHSRCRGTTAVVSFAGER
jgi:hypothetical protein